MSSEAERLAYVLDDEPGVRAFVRHVLSQLGFNTVLFSTTSQLLATFSNARPEVLVLDLALGHSDAIEVIHHLEALRYDGNVLLMSGRDEETIAEIQQIGMSRGLAMLPYLHKPFRADDLKNRLAAKAEKADMPWHPADIGVTKVDLREALQKGWVELWYQPKLDFKSLEVCGAEALARVRHPVHGIVPPAAFLPPPGDPQYLPLSLFVMQRVIATWRQLADRGMPLTLSLNIPVSIMIGPAFVSMIRELLPKHSQFRGLIIEVTEDEVIRDPNLIREIATQLKLYSVWMSIDDFGSAYSSLSRLLEISCVELKLDRSFVTNCHFDQLKRALCQTVVDLAHRFGALVCAEGVETAEDFYCLVDLGCDSAQGFFFARPMAEDDFVSEVPDLARRFRENLPVRQSTSAP